MYRKSTTYGFARTSKFVEQRVKTATEQRGFAKTRILTHWEEFVGSDLASHARPVEIKYGKGSFGATLTILTSGAHAPILEMRRDGIRERINAVYGYNAISRVRITQTAATGFADGQVQFGAAPKAVKTPDAQSKTAAQNITTGVENDALRAALEELGAHIISQKSKGSSEPSQT